MMMVCPLVIAENVLLGFGLLAPAGPAFWGWPAPFEGHPPPLEICIPVLR